MCGIVGFYTSAAKSNNYQAYLVRATAALSKRGPDAQQTVRLSEHTGFGHARLSVIDTSSSANQPMTDASGRYTIIFNGEIFNFRELQQAHLADVPLHTHSDTEVLLYLYIRMGQQCLSLLNGFFAFAVYDSQTREIFLARDRMGIKPLHLYQHEGEVIFASELKALLQFPVLRQINPDALVLYLQLNYLPGELSMLQQVRKLLPGHWARISPQGAVHTERYYRPPYTPGSNVTAEGLDYEGAKKQLRELVEAAVQRRLVSDVPLGTFLSGGIDSSIVTYCASRQVNDLHTFSIGFKDDPYFDETAYANLVAAAYHTRHTVFPVTDDDMCSHITDILEYMDEPFADSSAIAVYMLSYYTRQKVTVALSGDGGDELFAGYNKHRAEAMARQPRLLNVLLKAGAPLLARLPQSRHSAWMNRGRQLARYAEGLTLSPAERYWRWCAFQTEAAARDLLLHPEQSDAAQTAAVRQALTGFIGTEGDLNDVLLADLQLVLPGDMLTKVDSMSMANSLEVRVPLLDHTIVDFAFSLPVSFKLHDGSGKRLLKEAFADVLPPELLHRPKHGFEVPLLKWIRQEWRTLVADDLLSDRFVRDQQIFSPEAIQRLKQRVFGPNPGEAHAIVWALMVFQYWYKKYIAA